MKKEYKVLLKDKAGVLHSSKLCVEGDNPAKLSVVDAVNGNVEFFEGEDFFSALVSLRRRMESLGLLINCNGARVDVYPSPMSRGMGGRMAYVHVYGKPALKADLLDIFESTDFDKIGTVDQQLKFHNEWMSFFKKK